MNFPIQLHINLCFQHRDESCFIAFHCNMTMDLEKMLVRFDLHICCQAPLVGELRAFRETLLNRLDRCKLNWELGHHRLSGPQKRFGWHASLVGGDWNWFNQWLMMVNDG